MLRSRWWRGLLAWQHGLVVSVVPKINNNNNNTKIYNAHMQSSNKHQSEARAVARWPLTLTKLPCIDPRLVLLSVTVAAAPAGWPVILKW